jgi:hypothetical protein
MGNGATLLEKSRKETVVVEMLLSYGVSKSHAILVVSEMWNEHDLDEIISMAPEKVQELAEDITDIMGS